MKIKNKILNFILLITSSNIFFNLFNKDQINIANNLNNKSQNNIEKFNNTKCTKKISMYNLGENNSEELIIDNYSVDDKYQTHGWTIKKFPSVCTNLSDRPLQGLFDFCGGKIIHESIEHEISYIAPHAAETGFADLHFENVSFDFPSTIKKIGNSAFRNNGDNILGIYFRDGIKEIEHSAFAENIFKDTTIKLPNSIETIGNGCFSLTNVQTLDLSDLDHVIKLDQCPFYKEYGTFNVDSTEKHGCFGYLFRKFKNIYVKNQEMLDKYLADPLWGASNEKGGARKYLKVIDHHSVSLPKYDIYIRASRLQKEYTNDKGFIKINTIDPNNIFINGQEDFCFRKDHYNFNNGKISFCGVEYPITGIGKKAFYSGSGSLQDEFHETNLTIPSTIRYIDDEAFYNCSCSSYREIIGLNFEEGIESIGKSAFEKCNDINQETIKLPNSLKKLGNRAFVNTGALKYFDLTALDHVIDVECDPLSDDGCLPTHQIEKIYLKDEEMKAKYLRHKYWKSCAKYFEVKGVPSTPLKILTIDARLIGGDNGNITLDVTDPNNAIIEKCDSKFSISRNFNFNNGKFIYNGITYKITGINKKVFHHTTGSSHTSFYETNLTIPSTIWYIDDEAFYNNSRLAGRKEIISIHFEEGVKYIGPSAFEKCNDIKQDTLKLPNSLKWLGNRAFVNTGSLKYFDLTALDHVIDIDCDPLSKNGCLPTKQIEKIYLKNEEMKAKYLKHEYWKSCAKYFEVKEVPPSPVPDTKLTIDAAKLGAKSGSVTLDVADPNNCIIKKVSDDFKAIGSFNFNNGKFIHDGKKYTITKIADGAFKLFNQDHYLFENCNLTIPFTINEIGKEAFANCSRLDMHQTFKSINFENGIQSIGDRAFANTLNINSNHLITLPSSIRSLGNQAFENNYLNEIELSYIQDPIKVDSDVLSKNGCFANNNINKIYVSSQKIKERYLKAPWWNKVANIIEVK